MLELCRRARDASDGWFDPWGLPGGVDPTGLVKGWAAERALDELKARRRPRRDDQRRRRHRRVRRAGARAARGGSGSATRWPPIGSCSPSRLDGAGAVATSGAYERGEHLAGPGRRRRPPERAAVGHGDRPRPGVRRRAGHGAVRLGRAAARAHRPLARLPRARDRRRRRDPRTRRGCRRSSWHGVEAPVAPRASGPARAAQAGAAGSVIVTRVPAAGLRSPGGCRRPSRATPSARWPGRGPSRLAPGSATGRRGRSGRRRGRAPPAGCPRRGRRPTAAAALAEARTDDLHGAAGRRVLHGVPDDVASGAAHVAGRRPRPAPGPSAAAPASTPAAGGQRAQLRPPSAAPARPGRSGSRASRSWWASMRDSVSRSSTISDMRSTSSRPLTQHGAHLGSRSGPRRATSNSDFMTASGVRRSCEASAMKRFCAATFSRMGRSVLRA